MQADMTNALRTALIFAFALLFAGSRAAPSAAQDSDPETPRNVVFILSDDHRYDFMSFMEGAPDFLETPAMDRMAREGAHLANAFVSTSLCSPSRASILTGQLAHTHGVVDNLRRVPEGTRFFPQDLQEVGYRTGFFGKWHMGGASSEPRKGFDRWVSFRGQGSYYDPTLNIDGVEEQKRGYTAELLTDYALDWMKKQRDREEPFFAYLSHKNVHSSFKPAPQDSGRYADAEPAYPATMYTDAAGRESWPDWVKEQRSSWHGVDYMYHGALDFDTFYQRYAETVSGIDRSIGRVMDYLEKEGLAENTLVVYMGDNGFSFGEHGLIDKRHAFEESIRVPMLAWAPGFIEEGTRVDHMIQNIDVAPTVLSLAGAQFPEGHTVHGRSFMPLLAGESVDDWRESILYEYYWEHTFPQTPTQFALRTDRYKYIFYYGLWGEDAFFDLKNDPKETHNLIDSEAHQDKITSMRDRLFERLEATGGMQVPLRAPKGDRLDETRPEGESSTDPLVNDGGDARSGGGEDASERE
jgi:N-acetylglucosamine-6-sulfatase